MKGIIIEIYGNYAVMLNDNGEFTKIKNNNYDIGQKLIIKKRISTAFVSFAASFIILFISAFSGYSLYFTPDNYISIDINPSIQLTVNRMNRIIDVQSFNSDGDIVLGRGPFKNMTLETGIEKIIDISKELEYLRADNDEVLIDIVKEDKAALKEIRHRIQKYAHEPIVFDIEHSDENILKLSKLYNISVGRAKAIYDYTNAHGGDIKTNQKELSGVSVSKIKRASLSAEKQAEKSKSDQNSNNKDESEENIQSTIQPTSVPKESEQENIKDKPNSEQDKPKQAQDKPKPEQDKPKQAQDKPKPEQDKPKQAQDKSKQEQDKSKKAQAKGSPKKSAQAND